MHGSDFTEQVNSANQKLEKEIFCRKDDETIGVIEEEIRNKWTKLLANHVAIVVQKGMSLMTMNMTLRNSISKLRGAKRAYR